MHKWKKHEHNEKPIIFLGTGSCGKAAGAMQTLDTIKRILDELKTEAEIIEVGCIQPCYLEPLMDVKMPGKPRISFSNVENIKAEKILNKFFVDHEIPKTGLVGHFGENDKLDKAIPGFYEHPMMKGQVRLVLRNCGIIDPVDINHYLARDGYTALEKVLSEP